MQLVVTYEEDNEEQGRGSAEDIEFNFLTFVMQFHRSDGVVSPHQSEHLYMDEMPQKLI